jgi:uncharacterized protein (TIGR00290 family)
MSNKPYKALVSWSSGKDAAWSLHCIQKTGDYEVLGLVTSVNQAAHRVAMHGVRLEILEQQARATGLELFVVNLPWPCNNDEYERRMTDCLQSLIRELDVTHIIFGDLFLEDIRQYREDQMKKIGLQAVFPLWGQTTSTVAKEMLSGGLEAYISCVDKEQLSEGFSGRKYDQRLLDDLPEETDPCGENGEFHTMVTNGPMFKNGIVVNRGPLKADPRFVYTDFHQTAPDFT